MPTLADYMSGNQPGMVLPTGGNQNYTDNVNPAPITFHDVLAHITGQQQSAQQIPQASPVQNQGDISLSGVPTSQISTYIQQQLGAKQPTDPGQVQDILAGRFHPFNFNDVGAAAQQSAQSGGFVSAQGIADARQGDVINKLGEIQKLQKNLSGGDLPSDIQTAQYLQAHPELQPLFFASKRAQKVIDLGGEQVGIDPYGKPINTYTKSLPPQDQPLVKGAQSRAQEDAKNTSDIVAAPAKAVAEKTGAIQGQQIANLPVTEQNTAYAQKLLTDLVNHPGIDSSLGLYSLSPTIPGTAQSDFRNRLNQVGGIAFLQAFQTLKGAGSISNAEGDKATAAITRLMDQKTSKPAFIESANELYNILDVGIRRARGEAAGNFNQTFSSQDFGGKAIPAQNEANKNISGKVVHFNDLPP